MDIERVTAGYETSLSATDLREQTVHFYVSHIRAFFKAEGITRLEEFDSSRIESFLGRLKAAGRSDSYRNIHYRSLRRFTAWVLKRPALAQCLSEPNPMAIIEPVKVRLKKPLPFTLDDVGAMLQAIKNTSRYPRRDEAMLSMLFDTGMRRGELVGVRFCDIDWQRRVIHVSGKMGEREVYTSSRNLRILKRYLREERKEAPGGEPYVFTSMSGHQLRPDGVTLIIRRIAERAGIAMQHDREGQPRRYIGPHALRHGFALTYLDNGGDEFHLQSAMGHKSLKMTSRYVNRSTDEMVRAHESFSPLERLNRLKGKG